MSIQVVCHFRGQSAKAVWLPSVPTIGSLIDSDGSLWRVDAVVYLPLMAQVFAIPASEDTAGYLAAWDEPPDGREAMAAIEPQA